MYYYRKKLPKIAKFFENILCYTAAITNLRLEMLQADRPIGIFDSGIGGLTVARAIHDQLPNESIIYFGDTAHTPWGSQSASAIQHYASRISETLLKQKCKVIVVACNTASAAAFGAVQEVVQDHALLFNVIDPVIDHIVKQQHTNIGLIGTKQTIKSGAYANRLKEKTSSINLQSLATPLLVPLIEEGLNKSKIAQDVIKHYLSNPALQDISALILGCTHYPLIRQEVTAYYTNQIEVIDSAQLISSVIAKELAQKNLCNTSAKVSKTFYVSHDSQFFSQTAQQFFPGDIKLETFPLWE
jgi:glutamate racemase